jgi:hypothetical protein
MQQWETEMTTSEDRIVRHERPGYVYAPAGLMAEPWGKTGHRTEVAAPIQEDHLRQRKWMDNDAGRDSLEYIWSLDDETVLEARFYGSTVHQEVCRRLDDGRGHGTNPYWVTMRAASVGYDRGLIDERELDRIADEA